MLVVSNCDISAARRNEKIRHGQKSQLLMNSHEGQVAHRAIRKISLNLRVGERQPEVPFYAIHGERCLKARDLYWLAWIALCESETNRNPHAFLPRKPEFNGFRILVRRSLPLRACKRSYDCQDEYTGSQVSPP